MATFQEPHSKKVKSVFNSWMKKAETVRFRRPESWNFEFALRINAVAGGSPNSFSRTATVKCPSYILLVTIVFCRGGSRKGSINSSDESRKRERDQFPPPCGTTILNPFYEYLFGCFVRRGSSRVLNDEQCLYRLFRIKLFAPRHDV